MKDHELYKHYIEYLKNKKSLSDGALHLVKISKSAFDDFIYIYNNNIDFKRIVDSLIIIENRDEKINKLLDDN